MPVEFKSQGLQLKEKLDELTSYISSVAVVSSFVVINLSKIPIIKQKEIKAEFERTISLFMKSGYSFFKEDSHQKIWVFKLSGD